MILLIHAMGLRESLSIFQLLISRSIKLKPGWLGTCLEVSISITHGTSIAPPVDFALLHAAVFVLFCVETVLLLLAAFWAGGGGGGGGLSRRT